VSQRIELKSRYVSLAVCVHSVALRRLPVYCHNECGRSLLLPYITTFSYEVGTPKGFLTRLNFEPGMPPHVVNPRSTLFRIIMTRSDRLSVPLHLCIMLRLTFNAYIYAELSPNKFNIRLNRGNVIGIFRCEENPSLLPRRLSHRVYPASSTSCLIFL